MVGCEKAIWPISRGQPKRNLELYHEIGLDGLKSDQKDFVVAHRVASSRFVAIP